MFYVIDKCARIISWFRYSVGAMYLATASSGLASMLVVYTGATWVADTMGDVIMGKLLIACGILGVFLSMYLFLSTLGRVIYQYLAEGLDAYRSHKG